MAFLWEGRFSSGPAESMEELDRSIAVDGRLWREDIEGSIAHAGMLGRRGIIPEADAARLVAELQKLSGELERGEVPIDPKAEDIHTFVEAVLTSRLGELGKRLHAGRSRNDQIALDERLWLRKSIAVLVRLLEETRVALEKRAVEHADTLMPGYTHLQHAQPVTLDTVLLAWSAMLARDAGRLADAAKRMDTCPLGAGALAGTGLPIDPADTARALGFARPVQNTIDAVADRDYVAETIAAIAILMSHLSRMCEDVVLWCSSEFGFAEPSEGYSTGSSMMPQKKNPDAAELIRGKTGRVYGDLAAILTVMKGIPFSYDRDLQEDKEPLFDAVDTASLCLRVFSGMMETMAFRPERMRAAAEDGFMNATDLAEYLVGKGLPFRDAHAAAAKAVRHCIETGKRIEYLTLSDLKGFSPAFEADVVGTLSMAECVRRRKIKPE
jgi:argininosuccinate lyase